MTKNPHAAQRQITHQRRAAKPHSALLANAKNAWSRARQKAISKEERASHINSLMEIVRGKIQDIVFKHDASRIVQTIVKRGNQQQREKVATELQGRFKELVENKYSKVRCVDGPVRSTLNVHQFLHRSLPISTTYTQMQRSGQFYFVTSMGARLHCTHHPKGVKTPQRMGVAAFLWYCKVRVQNKGGASLLRLVKILT